MKIQKSAEDYLETILILYNRRGTVHAIDIANELAFSKPSVSVAMKNLRENGYICVNENNEITLTESGRKIAEHVISSESFAAIKQHVQDNNEIPAKAEM